jgi:hypothetical protein
MVPRFLLGIKGIVADHTCPSFRQLRKLRVAPTMRDSHEFNDRRQSRGEPMARNFGLPQQVNRDHRGSIWPLLAIVFMLIGVINVAAHLHHR